MEYVRARARLTPSGDGGRRGTVVASPAGVRWRSRLGLRRTDLTGARVLSSSAADRDGESVLHLVLADRSTAELQLPTAPAGVLRERLSGAGSAAPSATGVAVSCPSVPRGWGAIVCVVLAVAWMTFILLPAATGYAATATVLHGTEEGFCYVQWQTRDGTTHRGESDCSDEPAGTSFRVWVAGWPMDPEPGTPALVLSLALVPGLPLAAGGALRLIQLRRRRQAPVPDPESDTPLPLPPALESAPPRGEAPAMSDDGTAAAVARGLRRAVAVLALGVVSCCCLWVFNRVLDRIDADFMAASDRSAGTVLSLEPDSKGHPGRASVRFTVDGRTVTHDVVLGGLVDDYDEGQHVTVFYDPAAPDRATIDDVVYEPGWAGWVMPPLLGGSFVATPLGLWLVVANRRMRRLLREQPWRVVGVRVVQDERRVWFITADGGIWRSQLDGDGGWRSGGGLTYPWEDEDGGGAWWVSSGTSAVFSPDEGSTLVRARRRPALPRRVRRSVAKAVAESRMEPGPDRRQR